MSAPAVSLNVLAEIVRAIPQTPVREAMANHLAQEMNRRCAGFNATRWYNVTGGKLTGKTQIDLPAEQPQ